MCVELHGKRALVTGGTKGIGAAIVHRLGAAGARVATTARSTAPTPASLFIEADISTAEGAARVAAGVLEAFGGIDIVVHNAGGHTSGTKTAADYTDENWRQALDLNLLAPVRIDRALIPAMVDHNAGAIVHVTSLARLVPTTAPLPYVGAKAALASYSKGLATKLGPRGVRVNAVMPGFIETEGARRLLNTINSDIDIARAELMRGIGGVPMGRPGRPEDIAELVAFLVSDRASWITGTEYHIDGGTIPVL